MFNIHGVSSVKQTELYTVEPLVHDPNTFEVEMAIEKLKIHKSPGSEQIPAEFISAAGRTMKKCYLESVSRGISCMK